MKKLTGNLINKVVHDIAVAAGPDDVLQGTLVATERGVVWIQDGAYGYPTYGEENTGRLAEWHLAWSLVEDLSTEDHGVTPTQVWIQAATSTERVQLRIPTTDYEDYEILS